ncbi:hypothetical protein L3C96_00005, partial [Escherichia coli]|uniref:hypothetical protein n=1 Tax=Escherichia coli TaxID=562 RepID=UPI003907EC6F|nr:hypothetical protein [Escherichia coli]
RLRFSGPKTSIICSPMTSLKTSIKTITYLSDIGCLEIQGASLLPLNLCRFHYFNIADQKSAIQIKTIKCESATCQND